MTQPCRLPSGGLMDRTRALNFTFNGRRMTGYAGDTLASALLANGVHHVARSLKYHRPRGIVSAGLEEPSALLSVDDGTGKTPNLKATEVLLRDGMKATSQNHWPSLEFDLGAGLQLGARLLTAGFYYKTFKWPRAAWHGFYEKLVRRAAGHGTADRTPNPALYDKRHRHCDMLIIGGGPAGLSAALTAARAGAETVIIEQDQRLGGCLLFEDATVETTAPIEWVQAALDELNALPNATIMPRTLAFGAYDHGLILAVEQPENGAAKAVFWKFRARRIILATGAIEQPVVFPGNDRPGIMLAGSVRHYLRRYAVIPGRSAALAIACPNELAATREALREAGVQIAGEVSDGDTILGTSGTGRVTGLKIRQARGAVKNLRCDLVCMSAGWAATAHLFAHGEGLLRFDDRLNCLVPASRGVTLLPAGGARGIFDIGECLADGKVAAENALKKPHADQDARSGHAMPRSGASARFASGPGKAFVDFQNDVTRADLAQAVREGYRDIELAKRYTTLGMGTDQGKTSWTNGILSLAGITARNPADIRHTTFRPPFSPIAIGALVGAETGRNMTPTRRTPFHKSFESAGCVFQTSGDWLYPRYFPEPGETMADAIERETRAVRSSLGCVDMSTLGKVDVKGPDALEFLSRLYCNGFATIGPGRLRYVLMLREDGMVFDDGTIACLSEDHFLVTMTTANAGSVWRHMLKLAQIDWPDLDVTLTSVTDQWASLAIAGPKARDLLIALKPDFATDRGAFPFACVREGILGGTLPARIFTVSFSGELSYEINVPAGHAGSLFDRVMEQGAKWQITPYGLETLDVLRIEKGHVSIGTEIDGRRTPADLGMGNMVSTRKDFIGRALLQRPALQDENRPRLVGLRPVDRSAHIPVAAHLADRPWKEGATLTSQGYLTACVPSQTLGHSIALGFLDRAQARAGEHLWAVSPVENRSVEVEICSPHFYDPKGARLHG